MSNVWIQKGDMTKLRAERAAKFAVEKHGWHYLKEGDEPVQGEPQGLDAPAEKVGEKIATSVDLGWLDEMQSKHSRIAKFAASRLDELAVQVSAPVTTGFDMPTDAPLTDAPFYGMPAHEAIKAASAYVDAALLEGQLEQEWANKARKSVIKAAEARIKALSK